MLHRSETWPVRRENEVALQRAEMRMVRWMCNVKGTLRRRLSHGYFSFIAKYTSNWLMSHQSHPQIITFKGAGPNFLA